MSRADKEPKFIVEHAQAVQVTRERVLHRSERGVESAVLDGLDSGGGVQQGHDVQRDLGLGLVEVAKQEPWCDPPADRIDPQGAAARTNRRDCRILNGEQLPGMGKEGPPVEGEPDAAGRGSDEQSRPQRPLQCGDPR